MTPHPELSMKRAPLLLAGFTAAALFAACGSGDGSRASDSSSTETERESEDSEDHSHDEDSLGTVEIGDLSVELAQGHGAITGGSEGHLVVKLPYSDSGSTVVRAWIGTEDRTLSYVGKGEYAPSHDDYDVHATAPDPLPADARWWIEIAKPDGTKVVGSAQPILE